MPRKFLNMPRNMAGIFVRQLAVLEESPYATNYLFCFGGRGGVILN